MKTFFLICVVIAGLFGGATVARKILTCSAAGRRRLSPV